MLGDDARERHRQVVAQRQIRFPGRFVLAAPQYFEDQLVAFFSVLSGQRLDVLERRRLERLETVAAVDVADDPDDMLAAADILGKKIAHAPGGAGRL
jgi:hypothetical protein